MQLGALPLSSESWGGGFSPFIPHFQPQLIMWQLYADSVVIIVLQKSKQTSRGKELGH